MRNETLQRIEDEDAGRFGVAPLLTPGPLALFSATLLGRPFDPHDERLTGLVRWARSESARAVVSGRVPLDRGTAYGYRLLYETLRPEAASVRPTSNHPATRAQWARVVGALPSLRHRQRAAILLRHLGGLDDRGIGAVLGLGPKAAAGVLRAAESRLAAVLGGPVDLKRALRTALERPLRVAEPSIAPPRRRSPVEVLIGPLPGAVEPVRIVREPLAVPVAVTRRVAGWGRRMLAAAAMTAVMVVGALLPTSPPADPSTDASPPPAVVDVHLATLGAP